jgi:glycosyltransferase involved in cell wall biosynthesis
MGEEQGGNLWDAMGIPYVNILMDHPFHYISQLEGAPENTILYVIDRNHVDFVKRFFPKIERCHFLAHAGCANAMQEILGGLQEDLVSRPRDIDVLYAGTLSRVLIEQLIPDFKDFPEINGVIFSRNCLEDLIQNPEQTTEEVIERNVKQEFENRDLELTDERLMDYIEGFRFLDGFAVSYFREMAVRIIVESGINVHVLGLGWEQCDWARDNEHLIHLGKVDAKEVLPYMLRSKIVLNTLTWFKDGAHDLIFNGMLAGAAVVSDESKYLREEETDQQTIAMFRLRELMKLPEMVADLLEDDKKRLSMARCGLEDAREHHSWRQAVGEIVDELGRV